MSVSGEKTTAKSAASYSQNLMMVDHPSAHTLEKGAVYSIFGQILEFS